MKKIRRLVIYQYAQNSICQTQDKLSLTLEKIECDSCSSYIL